MWRKDVCSHALLLAAILLTSCGGDPPADSTSMVSPQPIPNSSAPPPTIAYLSSRYDFTANVPAQTIAPTQASAAVASWSVSPSLPPGLLFSTTSGSISGMPSAPAAPAAYVVTATNSIGQSTTADLTISVAAAPLYDLGHADGIFLMRATANRVLSLDQVGHWTLQDYTTGAMLVRGDGACGSGADVVCGTPYFQGGYYRAVDLAGDVMLDGTLAASDRPTGVEIRSASDGHLLAALAGPFSWYELSTDGSYVCTGSATAVTAWSTTGQALFSRSGDYSKALAFCAPGEIRVALGSAAANVIETLSLTDGSSSVSPPFEGQFQSWFLDGGQFLTVEGSVVRIYSASAAQQDITQLPSTSNLTGQGNWFWTYDTSPLPHTLSIYRVGASASAAFSVSGVNPLPSGLTLALVSGQPGSEQISVMDLSGDSLTESSSNSVLLPLVTAYAPIPGGAWLVGDDRGVVVDGASPAGQPRFLTQGAVLSISGGTSYLSVATAAGKILTFDTATNSLASTIDFASSQLSTSSAGTVLAAVSDPAGSSTDWSVNVYSLPSGGLINTYPYASSMLLPIGMSVSGSGTVLAENFPIATSGCISQVLPITSGIPFWCDTTPSVSLLRLSPDGTYLAATFASSASSLWAPSATTNVYRNGTLATAVQGAAVGWLDDSRLLTNTYEAQGNYIRYVSAEIYDPTGKRIGSTELPEMHSIQVLTPDSVYSPDRNIIASLSTGHVSWASGNTATTAGAVSGSQVYFAAGSRILAQPY